MAAVVGSTKVPALSTREGFKAWKYDVCQFLRAKGLLAEYERCIDDSNGRILFPDEQAEQDMNTYFAQLVTGITGSAKDLIIGHSCVDLLDCLRLFEVSWGDGRVSDISIFANSFYNDAFDFTKGDLIAWINGKYALACRMNTMLPTNEARDFAMRHVLTTKCGPNFEKITNEARVNPPTWTVLRDRLVDWEKHNPSEKFEIQGKAFVTMQRGHDDIQVKVEKQNESIALLQKQLKNLSKGKKGGQRSHPYGNKGGQGSNSNNGHNSNNDNGNGYKPYSKKGGGKASGNGNGKPMFHGTCNICKRKGHSAKYCWYRKES
jgi:hypothetical protein